MWILPWFRSCVRDGSGRRNCPMYFRLETSKLVSRWIVATILAKVVLSVMGQTAEIFRRFGGTSSRNDDLRTKKFFRLWSVTVELVAALCMHVRDPSLTMTQFCTHLKTFLFRRAYYT